MKLSGPVLMLLGACSPAITETRMIQAQWREPSCPLELVQVDITAMSFNQTWDVLGYITLHEAKAPDPVSEENRKLVRPRACAMGGTSIAVAINSTSTSPAGQQGGGLVYMVLRPKEALATPSAF
jgi:hypothetical protein